MLSLQAITAFVFTTLADSVFIRWAFCHLQEGNSGATSQKQSVRK